MKWKTLLTLVALVFCHGARAQVYSNDVLQANWLCHSFGEVKVGDSASCELVLMNVSTDTLRVEYVITKSLHG